MPSDVVWATQDQSQLRWGIACEMKSVRHGLDCDDGQLTMQSVSTST
jgi:hypothetical protein